MESMARSLPIILITDATIDFEKPDISITFPKTAPSKKTGKKFLTKPTILSMKRPVNMGATRLGSMKSTAPMAAMGANRMTL
jgi:hypothetical protein